MSTATAGRAREYKARDHMIAHGWQFIMRAAASKGPADLLMAHETHGAALVQVGTRNKQIGPAARTRFLRAAYLCSALPLLVTVHLGKVKCWHVTSDSPRHWVDVTTTYFTEETRA